MQNATQIAQFCVTLCCLWISDGSPQFSLPRAIGENRGESGRIGENREIGIGKNRGESGRIEENGGNRAKQAKLRKNCGELWKTNAMSFQILQNGAIASYGQFFWQTATSTGFLHSKMIKDREHHGKPRKIFKNNVAVCKTQQIGSALFLGLSKQTKHLIVLTNQPQKQQIARLWLSVSHVSTNVLPKMTTFGKNLAHVFVWESFWSSFFFGGFVFWVILVFLERFAPFSTVLCTFSSGFPSCLFFALALLHICSSFIVYIFCFAYFERFAANLFSNKVFYFCVGTCILRMFSH